MSDLKETSLKQDQALLDQAVSILLKGRYMKTMRAENLREVLLPGTYLEVPENTTLIREGKTDDDLFFLLDGSLLVQSGKKTILQLNSPGDIVGELAVVSSAPRSADVVTEGPARLVRISSAVVKNATDPARANEILMLFSHIMAAKLRETSARAKLYEDAIHQAEQMATSQERLEGEIEDKLREITLYSKVVETGNDSVVIADNDGNILHYNPAAQKMFPGLGSEQQEGAPAGVAALIEGFDLGEFDKRKAKDFWRGEWSRPDGEKTVYLQASVAPIPGPDKALVGTAYQIRDISLQKAQEKAIEAKNEEIQRALVDLESTYQELQRNDRLKTETLTVVSDELSAPLRKIETYSDQLTQELRASGLHVSDMKVSGIREQSQYLKAISENISNLIEIQQSFQSLNSEMIDLRDVLKKVEEELRTLAARKNVHFNLNLPEDEMVFSGDPRQIQIVFNLLFEQTLTAAKENTDVELKASLVPETGQMRVEFSYSGPNFATVRPSSRASEQRFGLLIGLPLARKVISQYQGSLQFSGDARQAKVSVLLPRAQKEGLERPSRVLICDEQEMDRLIARGVIEHLWADSVILGIHDPFEFLDTYEDFKPDLVIIDPFFSEGGWANHRIIGSLVQNRRHVCPVLTVSTIYQDFAERDLAVERGVSDFLEKPFSIFDLRFKIRSLLQSHRKEETLHQSMDIAQRQAHTDGLTKLANRKHFDGFLETQVNYSRQTQKPCSLIMLDIDNFKHYNDTHGHQMGDEVLKVVAAVLTQNVRASDLAARYGGEEFALVLPETNKEWAAVVAEKVRRALQESDVPSASDQPLGFLSGSFGVSTFQDDADSPEGLIKAADECLYVAKDKGRNMVVKAGEHEPVKTT